MVLEIDDKGILAKKDFYDINDMNDLKFDKNRSETLKKRNFIYNFLSSIRQRINDPLGVRKKKREQGRDKNLFKFIQLLQLITIKLQYL